MITLRGSGSTKKVTISDNENGFIAVFWLSDGHIARKPSKLYKSEAGAYRAARKWLTEPAYRTICAWCGRDLGEAPEGCTQDTHGICVLCKDKLMKQAGLDPREESK